MKVSANLKTEETTIQKKLLELCDMYCKQCFERVPGGSPLLEKVLDMEPY